MRALWMAFLVTTLITGAAKLFFMGCIQDNTYGIHSPSGHASLSLTVYGMLAILLGQTLHGVGRAFVNILAILLITGISTSRFIFGSHSIAEVLVGLVIGMIGLGIGMKYFFSWKSELLRFNVPLLFVALVCIAYIMQGTHIPSETWIKKLAPLVPNYIEFCTQPSQDGTTSRPSKSS